MVLDGFPRFSGMAGDIYCDRWLNHATKEPKSTLHHISGIFCVVRLQAFDVDANVVRRRYQNPLSRARELRRPCRRPA